MPEVARIEDHALITHSSATCPARPASCDGPANVASPNATINGQPILRLGDTGHHAVCCGPNLWIAYQGSANFFVNGKAVVRKGDTTMHCGGFGEMRDGSSNVFDHSPALLISTATPPELTANRIVPLDRLNAVIEARREALAKQGINPRNTDTYDANVAMGTVAGNQTNKALIEEMAKKYGVPPALLAGVIASEMDFDHHWLTGAVDDGIMRNLGVGVGDGYGAASVHFDTLEAATRYLNEHHLTGAGDASQFWDNFDDVFLGVRFMGKNPAEFPTSVESAAIVTAAYMHLHGKPPDQLTPEDMAVIWAGYRTGVKDSGLPYKDGGFLSADDFKAHKANGAKPPFEMGGNAYQSLPEFERLAALFGHPVGSDDWRCCSCTAIEHKGIWGR